MSVRRRNRRHKLPQLGYRGPPANSGENRKGHAGRNGIIGALTESDDTSQEPVESIGLCAIRRQAHLALAATS